MTIQKKFILLTIGLFTLSCNNSQKERAKEEERIYQLTTDKETGIYLSTDWEQEGDIKIKKDTYHYKIRRTSDRSLPTVTDETGNEYADNQIELTITRNGDTNLLTKRLTKQNFSGFIGADFLSKAIFDGMGFDKEQHGMMHFVASFCYPHTDYCQLLNVIVSPKGNIEISSYNYPEEELPERHLESSTNSDLE